MNNSKEFLGTEPIGKLLFKLAVPSVIAQIVNMLYNLVDRVYIGHMQPVETVGKLALTGVGVCLPIIMIISAFSAFVASGGAPRASIAMGRGDYDQAQRILGGCFTLQVGISLVLTAVLLLCARPITRLMATPEAAVEGTVRYLTICFLGIPFITAYNIISAVSAAWAIPSALCILSPWPVRPTLRWITCSWARYAWALRARRWALRWRRPSA